MNNSLDFENTPQHRRQRQAKRVAYYILIGVFAVLVAVNIVGGGAVHGCMVPLAALAGLFMAALGTELRFTDPKRMVPSELIDQELEWLLGKGKVKSVSPLEYVFAQDRIRRRRAARWRCVLLSIPLWALIAYLAFMAIMTQQYGEPMAAALLFFLIGGAAAFTPNDVSACLPHARHVGVSRTAGAWGFSHRSLCTL